MGGIARQRDARRHEGPRQRQAERPGPRLVGDADLAELQAETLLQLVFEQELVAGHQLFGILCALHPDDRGAVGAILVGLEGQRGERARGEKMLLGAAIVRALVRDGADNAGLAVFPPYRLDAGHVAQS